MLRPYGYFASLLRTPETLQQLINDYFTSLSLLEESDTGQSAELPTLPGLCSFLGTSVANLKARMREEDTDPEAKYLIEQAITLIEDSIVKAGMDGRVNANITKFVLGSYCDTVDANRSSSSGAQSVTNNMLVIGWADPDTVRPGLTQKFLEENKHIKLISDTAEAVKRDENRMTAKQDVIDVEFIEDDIGDLMV